MKIIRVSLNVLISAILIWLVFYFVGIGKILKNIMQIDFWAVLLSALIIILLVFMYSLRILVMVRGLKKDVKPQKIFRYSILAFCLGAFSPARLGELSLINSLRKDKFPLGSASAVFIIDRVLSLFAIALFIVLGIYLITPLKENAFLIIALILFMTLAFVVMFSNKGLSIVKKVMFKSLKDKFKGFSSSIDTYKKKSKSAILQNIALNVSYLIIKTLPIFIILISLDEKVPFLLLLSINAVVTLAAFIPISFSGLGVREGGAVLLFSTMGYTSEKIATSYLFVSFLTYLMAAAILPFFVKKKAKSTK